MEAINSQGTELIEGCKDELSCASEKIKLSDLNESWGDTLSGLSGRKEKLNEGLALAKNYQVRGKSRLQKNFFSPLHGII